MVIGDTYTQHCHHCGRQYLTRYTDDYGYCTTQCEKLDNWRDDT
jgi:endogenous inhibitor of DNA gyrase (YacG/DUF329 family)